MWFFARVEIDGRARHIALMVQRGMDGFEFGKRYKHDAPARERTASPLLSNLRLRKQNALGKRGEDFKPPATAATTATPFVD